MSKAALEAPTKAQYRARAFGKWLTLDADPEQHEVVRTQIPFTTKSINEEERTIDFIGSTATKDRYGDVIEQGGWELANFVKNPVIPWGHNYSDPPVAKATEVGLRDGNLFFKGKFPSIAELSSDPNHPSDWALFVDSIYNSYKGGYLSAFSVGFIPLAWEIRKDEQGDAYFVFTKCELLEVSAVTVPANPEALTLAFEEGVLSDRQKHIMVKQAEKLITSLTKTTDSTTLKGMNDETKAYIDEKFEEVKSLLAPATKSEETEEQAAPVVEAEADEQPTEVTEEAANPSEQADGGTDETVTEEQLRSMIRGGLSQSLGIIE